MMADSIKHSAPNDRFQFEETKAAGSDSTSEELRKSNGLTAIGGAEDNGVFRTSNHDKSLEALGFPGDISLHQGAADANPKSGDGKNADNDNFRPAGDASKVAPTDAVPPATGGDTNVPHATGAAIKPGAESIGDVEKDMRLDKKAINEGVKKPAY